MKKRITFEKWYVRHIIKTPTLFYLFLIIGIILFFILSLSIKMDNGKSLLWQIFVNAGKGL